MRLCSFAQESTRYCNYSLNKFNNEIAFILPPWAPINESERATSRTYCIWEDSMKKCERDYFELINLGLKPQDARGVLPIDLKTEIVVTANLREWIHIFELRCAKAAHPSMRQLMIPLLEEFTRNVPTIFGNIYHKLGETESQG